MKFFLCKTENFLPLSLPYLLCAVHSFEDIPRVDKNLSKALHSSFSFFFISLLLSLFPAYTGLQI